MATLRDLLAQRAELEKQIESTQKQERGDAISKVKSLMAEYGLTVADLNARSATKTPGSSAGKGGKVAAKYRNASTGETWSGRGLQPRWLKTAIASGKKAEDFAV
ncbi:H-NS histone family protein [soil metagenome]